MTKRVKVNSKDLQSEIESEIVGIKAEEDVQAFLNAKGLS